MAGEGVLWLNSCRVVHAVEADGLGLERVGLVAKLGFTSDHGEALWEGSDLTLLTWGVVEEVVSAGVLAAAREVRCSRSLKGAKVRP